MYQSCVRAAEATSVVVKPTKFGPEVNMQPLTTGGLGVHGRHPHQFTPNSLVLVTRPSLRVCEERVVASVPRNIEETD
jgi:hypothetical protein